MKKILFTLSLAAVTGLGMTGCSDYLDSDYLFEERMTIESVFSSKDYSERWLARAYYFLGVDDMQEICSKKNMPFNFADDMYYGDGGYEGWKQGNYDETGYSGNSQGTWEAAYKGIRQAAIFLNNIDGNMDLTAEERSEMKGEAHFLRAYFYWMLIRMFGPVPIVPDEGIDYTLDYEDVTQPRNTYDECVNYIVSELEKAAPLLPLTRSGQNLTKPTRGAALALRARALLYAASPMYNGQAPAEVQAGMVTRDGKPLLSAAYDDYKWARAAAAARDVMELPGDRTDGKRYELYTASVRTSSGNSGTSIAYPTTLKPQEDPVNHFDEKKWPDGYMDIDPFESYRSVFNGEIHAYANPELIYSRGQNQGGEGINIMILHQLPRRWGFGYNSHGMTQKQCDAYYMADGTDCAGMNSMYAGQPGYTDPLRYNKDPRPTDLVTAEEAEQGLYPELGPNPTGVCKQYVGREPRFYASVAFNGSIWNLLNAEPEQNEDEEENIRIWYYLGDLNGYKQTTYYPRTGISVKKWVHPDDIGNVIEAAYSGNLTKKVPTDIRFAEILLIYAEAINEVQGSYIVPTWDGQSSWTITRDVNELKRGMQPIRIRAGIPDLPEEIYQDVNKFRIKLKRERQIELFAESHRYFDLRRWCDADEEEPRHVYGCNIYCREDQYQLFHTPVETPSLPSIFTTKMWFWPIAHGELLRNVELSQNPGWTDAE